MKLNGVEIGQKVDIILQRKSGESVFQSSIADFGGGIVLLMPLVSKGVLQRLTSVGKYTLMITTKQGIFKVEASFVGEKREQNGVFPAFRLCGESQKIQRRNHCRLTKIVGARMIADQREEEPSGKDQEETVQRMQVEGEGVFEVTILDLSAGGLRISSKMELDETDMYEIRFKLPDERSTQICCEGAIVWHFWNETLKIHQYGIQFLVIKQGLQDRIFQYIFQQQATEARSG